MSRGRRELGQDGEDLAARTLERLGYRILERNYRAPYGELDMIALHEGAVVFVEVKTRRSASFGAPELAVDMRKQRRMVRTAMGYLKAKDLHRHPCRFDVVAIGPKGEAEATVIRDAFAMDRGRW